MFSYVTIKRHTQMIDWDVNVTSIALIWSVVVTIIQLFHKQPNAMHSLQGNPYDMVF